MDFSSRDVTRVLDLAAGGDKHAAAQLLPLVYDELRRIARQRMAKTPPGNTLTPTALVHEAYIKVAGGQRLPWESRKRFFVAASRAMRNILVDQARRKAATKNGGARHRFELVESDVSIKPPADDIIALNEALSRLEHEEPEVGEVVSLLHFSGLTTQEAAEILQVSARTIERRWRYARAFLHRVLADASVHRAGAAHGH